MPSKREITEGRLQDALKRVLNGKPVRVKSTGAITLNKINNEAGLGNGYINSFKEFVADAEPRIKKFNDERKAAFADNTVIDESFLSAQEQLKLDLAKQKKLKERYRRERDDSLEAKRFLEAQHNTLMFKLYELQEELDRIKVIKL